jgi:hypothetical protein
MRVICCFGPVFLGVVLHLEAARVYFTDQPAGAPGYVMSVAPDGTEQRTVTILSNAPDVRGIAFHRASGRVYVLDNGASKRIYSMLPDGGDRQEIAPLGDFAADLEIDEVAGKIYWADTGAGLIRKANMDGTSPEVAVTVSAGSATAPYFLYVDATGGHIYWGVASSGSGPSSFRRATLDGTIDPVFAIGSLSRTRDIAIDTANGIAYWCDRQSGSLFKRALSGGNNQTVIANMNAPHGIALDLEAGKVYWADTGARGNPPSGLSPRRIARCNLDGTEFENIYVPMVNSEPWDLALDLQSPTYADWRTRFFSVNTPDAGPEDDADCDGAKNLLEYAMGTHPRRATNAPAIAISGTTVTYQRRLGSNLAYQAEVSTNLPDFNYNGDGTGLTWTVETGATPVAPEFEQVSITSGPALAGASNVFFRVRVDMEQAKRGRW